MACDRIRKYTAPLRTLTLIVSLPLNLHNASGFVVFVFHELNRDRPERLHLDFHFIDRETDKNIRCLR